MKRILVFALIILAVLSFAEEYKIIQQDESGRYYLDEETVLLLANYIKQLEELNNNYKAQIATLEQQTAKLQELLQLTETENKALKRELEETKKEINSLSTKTTIWSVVAAIAIGTSIVLFVTTQ